jgi:prepilin-type N-terminal cleavage/methylation domain-containing protein
MRTRQGPRGFTIIELMFVVVIIGIIAAVAIPNYLRFAKKAKEAVVTENMHTIQLAVESFAVSTVGVYPVPADEPVLKAELPGGAYPNNPFTSAETVVVWNADPAQPGDISITNVGAGYRLRGRGATGFLKDLTGGN